MKLKEIIGIYIKTRQLIFFFPFNKTISKYINIHPEIYNEQVRIEPEI